MFPLRSGQGCKGSQSTALKSPDFSGLFLGSIVAVAIIARRVPIVAVTVGVARRVVARTVSITVAIARTVGAISSGRERARRNTEANAGAAEAATASGFRRSRNYRCAQRSDRCNDECLLHTSSFRGAC